MIDSKESGGSRPGTAIFKGRSMPKNGIVFAIFILLAMPLQAIPVGKLPLPFEISNLLVYRLYWIASICIGAAAIVHVVSKAAEWKNEHIWSVASFLLAMFTLIFCNFLSEINTENFLYDDITRVGGSLVSCVIIAILPKLAGSRPDSRFPRTAATLFSLSGIALFVHFLVSTVVFYGFRYTEGAKYYDGHRVFPSLVVGIVVSIEILYYAMAVFILRDKKGGKPPGWKALHRFAYAAGIYVPVAVVIDYIRWLFPALWRIYPREDVFILPLFAGFLFLDAIDYANSYVAGMARENSECPEIFSAAGLTKRQCDVAVLLAQGFSYKEICGMLSIAIGTIQTHVAKIYQKLDVNCKEDLMNLMSGRKTTVARRGLAEPRHPAERSPRPA
jgi:DNA-binding CsgD family transcriptional regulator